jgi:hypothetical protein
MTRYITTALDKILWMKNWGTQMFMLFDIKMMVKSNAFEVGNQHSQLRPIPLKEGRICCVD